MSTAYATVEDMNRLWRPLTTAETARATNLLPVVSDFLRQEAMNRGSDLDAMIEAGQVLSNVVMQVTIDVTARALMTSTTSEPVTQYAQSAMGYSVSGSYLVPGGGLFIKDAELKKLGLKRQKIGVIEWYSV